MSELSPEEQQLAAAFGSSHAPERVGDYEAAAESGPRYGAGRPAGARAALAGVVAVAVVAAGVGVTLGLSGHRAVTAGAYGTPSPRQGAAMAYDASSHTVVLFGGADASDRALSDTWEWDGTGWTQLHPAHAPQARSGAALGFDPASGSLVLYGGLGTVAPAPDTAQICPAVGQSSGSSGSSVVISGGVAEQGVVVAPGASGTTSVNVGTTTGVTTLSPNQAPGAQPLPCQFVGGPSQRLNDTWTWDGHDWAQAPASSSSALASAFTTQLITDNESHRLVALSSGGGVIESFGSTTSGGGGGGAVTSGGTVSTFACPVPPPLPQPSAGTVPGTSNAGGAATLAPSCCPAVADCAGIPAPAVTDSVWEQGKWVELKTTGAAPASLGTVLADPRSGGIDNLTMAFNTCAMANTFSGGGIAAGGERATLIGCAPCGGPIVAPKSAGSEAPAGIACPLSRGGPAAPTKATRYRLDGTTWTEATLSMPFDLNLVGQSSLPGAVGIDSTGKTWTWDGGSAWVEQHPAHAPTGIYNGSVTFDAAHGVVVLFGGEAYAQGGVVQGVVTAPAPNDLGGPVPAGTSGPKGTDVAPPPTPQAPALSAATWLWDGHDWKLVSGASPSATPEVTPSATPSATPTEPPTPTSTDTPSATPSPDLSPPPCGSDPAAGVCASPTPQAIGSGGGVAP